MADGGRTRNRKGATMKKVAAFVLAAKSLDIPVRKMSDEERHDFSSFKKTVAKRCGNATVKEFSNLKTGRIKNNSEAKQNVFGHCLSKSEVLAAEHAWNNPGKLVYERNSPLGEVKDLSNPKDAANIAGKEKRGVKTYNVYAMSYNNTTWQVKTESRKTEGKMFEQLYHIMKKK